MRQGLSEESKPIVINKTVSCLEVAITEPKTAFSEQQSSVSCSNGHHTMETPFRVGLHKISQPEELEDKKRLLFVSFYVF